jgi:hypothetical protein
VPWWLTYYADVIIFNALFCRLTFGDEECYVKKDFSSRKQEVGKKWNPNMTLNESTEKRSSNALDADFARRSVRFTVPRSGLPTMLGVRC